MAKTKEVIEVTIDKEDEKIVSTEESESLQKIGWVVTEIFLDKTTNKKMHKVVLQK